MKAGDWTIHHAVETVSTNLDARRGVPWDVFTADFQTAGRGRLDHRWLSPPGVNLMMTAVVPVGGLSPSHVATLPLVVGLAVVRAVRLFCGEQTSPEWGQTSPRVMLKWPNDVLIEGRKVCGILCERVDACVLTGIGVNVGEQSFPPEIAGHACCLANFNNSERGPVPTIAEVRDAILTELATLYEYWSTEGFEVLCPEITSVDALRGKVLAVTQSDRDEAPFEGLCGGICRDGSLAVAGQPVYAGEAHVLAASGASFLFLREAGNMVK